MIRRCAVLSYPGLPCPATSYHQVLPPVMCHVTAAPAVISPHCLLSCATVYPASASCLSRFLLLCASRSVCVLSVCTHVLCSFDPLVSHPYLPAFCSLAPLFLSHHRLTSSDLGIDHRPTRTSQCHMLCTHPLPIPQAICTILGMHQFIEAV